MALMKKHFEQATAIMDERLAFIKDVTEVLQKHSIERPLHYLANQTGSDDKEGRLCVLLAAVKNEYMKDLPAYIAIAKELKPGKKSVPGRKP